MEYEIHTDDDGETVKTYLRESLRLSSHLVTKLKQDPQGILLNGQRVTVRAVLHEGDRLSLSTEDKEENAHLIPTPMPLSVLYEDAYIIALDKPPYMPTHPSHGHFTDTLANGLCAYMKDRGTPFVFRAVNRLDRNTSGAVLIAKTADAAHRFSALVSSGGIRKTYLALVSGDPGDRGEITGYIRRTGNSIITRELLPAPTEGASYSQTTYETLVRQSSFSLLRLTPQTGRTHQLRVHLSSVGHPILGDELYGGDPTEDRHMLHAEVLSFYHPYTDVLCRIRAPIPADFASAAKKRGIRIHE